jgi:hypothetical protein
MEAINFSETMVTLHPEDGSNTFVRNVGKHLQENMASQLRRPRSTSALCSVRLTPGKEPAMRTAQELGGPQSRSVRGDSGEKNTWYFRKSDRGRPFLFIYDVFNDALSISDYTALNVWMINELERTWTEPVALSGGTEGNHEKLQSARRSPGLDLNPGPPEYEVILLTGHKWRSFPGRPVCT